MANESYNPYSQQIEQNKLPWYISETFINSVEIRSPFIAGNKWYIWWTLQVWQNWILIDWSQKIIRSINYKENESWWIIKWNWDSEFNNITVRWNILWWKTSYSDSNDWYYIWKDTDNIYKVNIWNWTNSLKWDWIWLIIKWDITAWNISWVNISWSKLTSLSNDTYTSLIIDWWFITLSESLQYRKTIVSPSWINILSDVWTDKSLLEIEQYWFDWWRFKSAQLKFNYDWLEDTWWNIYWVNNWIMIYSNYDNTWLSIMDRRIWFQVDTVWTWARTIAWYMKTEINNNIYYIPYYN